MPLPAIEALLDRAFGADRRRRTAYAIRADAAPLAGLSFALSDAGGLIAALLAFPITLAVDDGTRVPLVMVGPVAVAPERQSEGHGAALMRALLAAAGDAPLMLIGDPEYYGRFGFTAARTGQWRAPGPVERHRLLARGPVADQAGMLGPA
ncbi:N-acetyltransferase [Sphingomonas sp.]|uniref:GNAT family N-acetyltransferase n=1 Tax=Sphingomonas sp. TaxID=28214 RepID=UPI0025CBA2CD|nr:N-acetyltransferase [Sphingomonas sp.]